MFDTITLTVPLHLTPDNLSRAKAFTFSKEGISRTKYTFQDDCIPKITYRDYTQMLEVELSIPKFLYGNNVNLLKESDIPLFFQRLQERLRELFSIDIGMKDWYTKRLDVCWNFKANEHIDMYLKQLAEMKLPRLKVGTYGHRETVVHYNSSRRISFYNKQKECVGTKQPQDAIAQAKGLLRMEINVREKQLTKYSSSRKATDYLTKDFFDYITKPILKQIQFTPTVEGVPLQWLQDHAHRISQIESVIGFNTLHQWFSQSELKPLYSDSTYDRRKQWAKEIKFPVQTTLASLQIDYAALG